MGYIRRRVRILILPIGLLLAAATAYAVSTTSEAGAEASAYAIKISVPGQGVFATPVASSPPDQTLPSTTFRYPADGLVLSADSTTASANATATGGAATGMATSELSGIRLFNGEISIGRVVASAIAAATPEEANAVSYTHLTLPTNRE